MSPRWPVYFAAAGPVACGALVWRTAGALRVTVVVKATFGLVPDADALVVDPVAIGGAGVPLNPVGVGGAGARPPNLVHPANPHRPAGFGPIAPSWPLRRKFLATLAQSKDGVLEVPDGFDFRAFHAAPSDQQVRHLG